MVKNFRYKNYQIDLEQWRKEVFQDRNFLIGAAVGSGLVAQASVRGGASFLIALSAGILRQRGAPSIASMLPIGCDNDAVGHYAETEILGNVDVPVFFGASVMDEAMDMDAFLAKIQNRGFAGVVNFQSCQHFGKKIRERLTERGLGIERECVFLKKAQDRGLLALAYVSNRAEASMMASAGIKMICLNYGWNVGGEAGLDIGVSLDTATDLARRISEDIRKINKDVIFLIEGGPIKDVLDIFKVSSIARSHGYIGGSTLDRLPLERAVARETSAFKSARFQTPKTRMQTINNHVFSRTLGLAGGSDQIALLKDQISQIANSQCHMLVRSEPRNRAEDVARSIIKLSSNSHRNIFYVDLNDVKGKEYAHLFGSYNEVTRRRTISMVEKAVGGTLLIRAASGVPQKVSNMLARLNRSNRYVREGDNLDMPCATRIIIIEEGLQFDEALESAFDNNSITLPPLKFRAEDIPDLAKQYLIHIEDKIGRLYHFHASALPLLVGYSWPKNLDQFYSVIESAIALAEGDEIGRTPVKKALEQLGDKGEPSRVADERQLILNALNRNRFRRGETAKELGITRRTLYNKLKKFNLDQL